MSLEIRTRYNTSIIQLGTARFDAAPFSKTEFVSDLLHSLSMKRQEVRENEIVGLNVEGRMDGWMEGGETLWFTYSRLASPRPPFLARLREAFLESQVYLHRSTLHLEGHSHNAGARKFRPPRRARSGLAVRGARKGAGRAYLTRENIRRRRRGREGESSTKLHYFRQLSTRRKERARARARRVT